MNTFLIIDIDQHTAMVSFVVEGCLKFDRSTVTPNDQQVAFHQKFVNTPKGPLAKDLFTQVSSKSVEFCTRRSVLSVFKQ